MSNTQTLLPLRNLVVTLMLDRSIEALLTDEEVNEKESSGDQEFRRNTYYLKDAFNQQGVTVTDVTVEQDSGDESDGYDLALMFIRGDEAVILDLDCPAYCDDECDASLDSASPVMTLQEAREELQRRAVAYREGIERHLARYQESCDRMFAQLGATV